MAQREKGGRVVFIGNIPYGVSEEQICEIFGRVGKVVSFRLVYDKETNRPKGFGFLEYTDVDAAASAVRNLNEHEIMGRTLRVDYSNDNGGGKGNKDDARAPPATHANPVQPNGAPPAPLPQLPPGVELPPGVTAPDAISQTLTALPSPQLLDILSQMKTLATENPGAATELLSQAPQLGYAIFQALLLLGLVDLSVLSSLVNSTAAAPAPPPPQPQLPIQQHLPYQQPPPQQIPAPYAQPPPAQYAVPPQPPMAYQQPAPYGYAPTPPQAQTLYQPPPPAVQAAPRIPQPTPAQIQQWQALAPEQQAVVRQVLSIPQEQVYAMEAGQRDQILNLRNSYGWVQG